jgi:hypothetical protein
LARDDEELFPHGKDGDRLARVKGSVVLERIFAEYQVCYDKRKSGFLIAKHVNEQNQPALKEICDILRDLLSL